MVKEDIIQEPSKEKSSLNEWQELNLRVERLKILLEKYPDRDDFEDLESQVKDIAKRLDTLTENGKDMQTELDLLDKERKDTSDSKKRLIEQSVLLVVGGIISAILSHYFL